jgi:bisphosphoglycerate-dependent phosphoglycerate mutase
MAQVCEQIYNPDTDENEEFCWDDGSNEIDESVSGDAIGESVSGSFTWGDVPGAEGSKSTVDSKTGNITYQYDDGSTMTVDSTGTPVSNTESADAKGNSAAFNRSLAWATKTFGPTAGKVFSNMMANPGASLVAALAAAKAFAGSDKEGGYNIPIPKLDMVQQQVEYNDPNRRPGAAGRQYFTDPRYVKEGDADAIAGAQGAANAQAQGILAAYKPTAAPAVNPYIGKMKRDYNPAPVAAKPTTAGTTADTTMTTTPKAGIAALPVMPTKEQLMDPNYKIPMANGGIAMAKGRYLQGSTDGMADEIPSSIDGNQKAALSHGEFVIPADVVSHLGNGNSDAGADKLYQMMDRIREARTGTKQQGKKINPDKFMPGGLAASKYAKGGEVMGFIEGGGVPLDTSKTSTLSPWAGDYVTNMLGKTEALTNAPMQTYKGPLTAGASDLQQQGFAGLSETAAAGYQPGSFTNQFTAPGTYKPTTSSFDAAAASQYMNPYLQASLNPQLEEARRQSQITQQQNAAKMTSAGAFGGSRGAIMDAETQRSLGANMANITGTGYNTAYDKAMSQFNADQQRKMQEAQYGATQGMTSAQNTAQYGEAAQKAAEDSRRYSADFGLKSLSDLMRAGETQRGIESEGIAADKRQFDEQQARPYTNLEFQRKMLEGLPIGASTTSVNQDAMSKMQSDISGIASLVDKLSKLGIKPV